MLVHMFVLINVYLGKMSQSNGPPKNRSSIIDPCVLHYSVVCWQIEPQVRFIVQVSIPMRIAWFCMYNILYIYIYMFLYYTYSEIVNMNYMKYIMYIIIYNIWIPCDLHKALHTGPFARILAGEWPVCMHPRGVAEENCRKWPIGSYTIAPHYAGNFQTTLKWFISQRKVDSLICHANGQLSSIIHILGCLGWALARPAR